MEKCFSLSKCREKDAGVARGWKEAKQIEGF